MKLAVRAKALGKKLTLMTTAFVLAVSSLTALTPFVLAERASAVDSVTISNVAELCDAIDNQADGQVWTISAGAYGVDRCNSISAEGRTGWYLPITADNLTINGIGNPTLYGTGFAANGAWQTQNFVTVFGDNVTINGLTLMPKVEPNKTIEVLGSNFTLRNSTIAPNTLTNPAEYNSIADPQDRSDLKEWGGSLYFSHAGNHTVENVTIKNSGISFRYAPAGTHIAFSNVKLDYNTSVDWINNYRYSSGFNNAGNSITGSIAAVYHVSSAQNNLESVLAAVKDGDVIEIDSDLTLSKQATVNKAVTINGNNHTVTGSFIKTNNGNNSVIGVWSDNVTINDLVVDAVNGTTNQLHGINVFEASNVKLNNITARNGRSGVVVNGSTVTINGISTSGNVWHGINVDEPGAHLTIKGVTSHTEMWNIFVDDRTVGQVTDVNHRYDKTSLGAADIYTLDTSAPSVSKVRLNSETISGQYQRNANCEAINKLYPVRGTLNLTAVVNDVTGDAQSVHYTVRKLLDNGCSDSATYRSGNIALQQSNKNANNWNQPASTVFDSAAEGLNGKYTIVLVVKDDAGNQTVKYVDLNIDNTAPKIIVKQAGTAFPSPASVGSTTDKVFSKVSFKLSDNNAVDYAVINGHHMELSNGPWSDANFDAIKGYLTEDSNNSITVYDVFGNSTTYGFTYDKTVPVLTVDAPADLVTYGNSLTVTGSVFDDNLKEYKYQILDENKQNTLGSIGWSRLGGTSNATGDLFTADISNLADGTYYISVWATDKAGNATNTSGNRLEAPYIMKFTVDRAVNVSIDTIASNTATPTIKGQMTRNADGSSVANTDVVVTVDGTSYTTTTDTDGKWSVTPTVGAGAHTVTVALAGGVSLASTSFTTVFAPVDEEEEEETANPAGRTPLQTPAAATPLIVNPAGQAALGANDDADDNGTPAVEGTSTEKNLAAAVNNTDGSAFGLAWYWWLLIVAGLAAVLWWIIAATRRRQAEN